MLGPVGGATAQPPSASAIAATGSTTRMVRVLVLIPVRFSKKSFDSATLDEIRPGMSYRIVTGYFRRYGASTQQVRCKSCGAWTFGAASQRPVRNAYQCNAPVAAALRS